MLTLVTISTYNHFCAVCGYDLWAKDNITLQCTTWRVFISEIDIEHKHSIQLK